ncbi:MAG: hypothetical protein ACREFG_12870 [Chthoniobacterales bacterium]
MRLAELLQADHLCLPGRAMRKDGAADTAQANNRDVVIHSRIFRHAIENHQRSPNEKRLCSRIHKFVILSEGKELTSHLGARPKRESNKACDIENSVPLGVSLR